MSSAKLAAMMAEQHKNESGGPADTPGTGKGQKVASRVGEITPVPTQPSAEDDDGHSGRPAV